MNNKTYVYKLGETKPYLTFDDYSQRPTSSFISKNEMFLILGMDSGTVKIYDLANGRCLRSFQAHRTAVTQITITNNSQFMATGCVDGQVRFWDLEQHQLLQDIVSLNALVQTTNKLTSEVQNPQISALAFNYQQTWLFIGDQSGRVLIWNLQEMLFTAELMLSKEILQLHPHQIQNFLFISCTNQLNIVNLETYQLIKQIPRQYYRVFTPLKNNILVGIRATGMDVCDMMNVQQGNFIIASQEYNFKQVVFCGERKTTTIPQILVFQNEKATGTVTIDVCSLKVMDCFYQYLPQKAQETIQLQKQQSAAAQLPAPKYQTDKPSAQPHVESAAPRSSSEQVNQFMLRHNIRMKLLNDRLLMLKQVDNADPLQSAINTGDLNLFISVYSNVSLNKLDLAESAQIVGFLNNQVQVSASLSVDQVQFIVQTVCKLTKLFSQVVNDTEFIYNNNKGDRNRDFAIEERYNRTQDFKQRVVQFYNSIVFVSQGTADSKTAIKLKAGIDELRRYGWR